MGNACCGSSKEANKGTAFASISNNENNNNNNIINNRRIRRDNDHDDDVVLGDRRSNDHQQHDGGDHHHDGNKSMMNGILNTNEQQQQYEGIVGVGGMLVDGVPSWDHHSNDPRFLVGNAAAHEHHNHHENLTAAELADREEQRRRIIEEEERIRNEMIIVQNVGREMISVRSTRGSTGYYDQGFAAALTRHLERTTKFQDHVPSILPSIPISEQQQQKQQQDNNSEQQRIGKSRGGSQQPATAARSKKGRVKNINTNNASSSSLSTSSERPETMSSLSVNDGGTSSEKATAVWNRLSRPSLLSLSSPSTSEGDPHTTDDTTDGTDDGQQQQQQQQTGPRQRRGRLLLFRDSIGNDNDENPIKYLDQIAESYLDHVIPKKEHLFTGVGPIVENIL